MIQRHWLALAGIVTVVTVAVGGGVILQNRTTADQVAAVSPALTDSVAASARAPQAGLPDGVWLAGESAAAPNSSIASGSVLQAGRPDGFWAPVATAPADFSCGTRGGPC